MTRRYRNGQLVMSTAELREALSDIGEYSCTIPTGTRIGKFWLRNRAAYTNPRLPDDWELCQYQPSKEPGYVDIKRWPIYVTDFEEGCARLARSPF